MTDYQTKEGRLERRTTPRSKIPLAVYGFLALALFIIAASDLIS